MRHTLPLLLLCILAGCGGWIMTGCTSPQEKTVVFSYHHMADNSWDRQDSILFPIDSVSHSGQYRLSVMMRATSEVPFQRVAVVVEQSFVHPRFHRKDTVWATLTDNRGNMDGKGLVLHNYDFPDSQPLRLHRGQKGIVRITHIMRRMQIDGIQDVGIRIQRIQPQQ